MIKLILPFSSVDVQLASLLANRFLTMKDMPETELVVTCCWKDHFGIDQFVKELEPAFKKVHQFVMEDVPEDEGWPIAPNHMFYNICRWLHAQGNKDPFYFFEADNFPLYPGWLAAFEQEYKEAGKPYMGFINKTWVTVEGVRGVERGTHMAGTGIYPANFLEICNGIHTLTDVPWDVDIQEEVVPECHHTNKIHHAWKTGKYHYKGRELVAEPLNEYKRYGGPVHPEALVIHGCKDLSLYRLTIRPRRLTSETHG
jgi:hypothetical protein